MVKLGSATNDGKEIHKDPPEKLINRKILDWTECDGCELFVTDTNFGSSIT